MSHPYSYHCGCASCDRTEEADERRDEYIEDFAPTVAKSIVGRDDVQERAINGLGDNDKDTILADAFRFFGQFHAAETDAGMADAGYALYRMIKPYIEGAALEVAREEVAAEYDRKDAA